MIEAEVMTEFMAGGPEAGVTDDPVGALRADPGIAGVRKPRVARDDDVEVVTCIIESLSGRRGAGIAQQRREVANIIRCSFGKADMNEIAWLRRMRQTFQIHDAIR